MYLDDILIFSRSYKEHVSHVRQVLQRLKENKLFVKAKKCHVSTVSFLGFIIEQGQLQPDPEKIRGKGLRSAHRLKSRQAPWAPVLGRFNFTLTYRPGSKTDTLSRQFSPAVEESAEETIIQPSFVVGAAGRRCRRPCKVNPCPVNAHEIGYLFLQI